MAISLPTTQICKRAGWKPCYGLDEGLRRTIEWWRLAYDLQRHAANPHADQREQG